MISKCKKCRADLTIESDVEITGLWCEDCATKELKKRS